MIRPVRSLLGVSSLALLLAAPGCDSPPPRPVATPASSDDAATTASDASTPGDLPGAENDTDTRRVILANVLKLIRDAAVNPAGDNFNIATENLNEYFADARADEFNLSDDTREFLLTQDIPPGALEALQQRRFLQTDGRHIEDCLMYQSLARRVAGEGDRLTQVRRIFDWVVKHNTLVPNGALARPGLFQAQARPYDLLVRGMATEDRGAWTERGWLFLVLCRQLNLDAGLVVYSHPRFVQGPLPRSPDLGADTLNTYLGNALNRLPARFWACAVLIDGKAYLFDPRIGLPIPSADGKGVATLEQAMTDPNVLGRLDISGRTYEPSFSDIAAGPVRILLESSLSVFAPRMKLLQRDLAARNRMVIYRDPVEQAAVFQQALGPRCEGVGLWPLPMSVEYNLFNDSNFMSATQYPLEIFSKRWPLLGARLQQLRGETESAINSYVVFRYAESPVEVDGKTPIDPRIQQILDIFASYYLALAQLEKGDMNQARKMFEKILVDLPEPDPGSRFYFNMFRWGAITNLGLLHAEAGNPALASRYLTEEMPTFQLHGNLVKARELIWDSPFVPDPATPRVIETRKKAFAPAAISRPTN